MSTPSVGVVVVAYGNSPWLEQVAQDILASEDVALDVVIVDNLYVEHGCGRDTVRAALEVLRGEGLVIKRRGFPARVTPHAERSPVPLPPGAAVGARMPSRPEAAEHACRPEVPLLTVNGGAGQLSVYPADRVVLIAAAG